MTTTQYFPFGKTRAQRFIATVAAVAATASLLAAFDVSSAKAATEPAATAPAALLPPASAVASADDGSRSDGPRGRMRERGHERAQDRERPAIDKHLTSDQVRDIVAGNLALRGNANLKVGKVTAKEDGVVTVEIVTKTGALVDTRDISTKTGFPAGLERRFGQMRHRMMAQHGDHRGPRGERGVGEKARDLALTTDQAKKLAEAHLIMRGNPHLKVGAVKEKDADTISVDIVASDNSLVSQQLIDRHSGRPQRPFGERKS
ncbi:MAG: hypothetical protein ACYCZX_01420 [Rhodospirillaceae bacterium]